MRAVVAAILFVAALAAPARAFDKVLLKDGRTIEGTLIPSTDGTMYRLKVKAIEIPIPAASVEKTFVENLDNYKPKSPEEEEFLKKGFVLFEGRWLSKANRDDLLAKRAAADKAAVDDAKKRRQWKNAVTKESTHFSVKSNADPALVDDYISRLEGFYKQFGDDWGLKVSGGSKGGKLTAEVHRDNEIMDVIFNGGSISFGGNILVFYDSEDPAGSLRELYQDAFWQLSFYVNPKFIYPSWIRNGLADYYATTERSPDGKLSFGAPQFGFILDLREGAKENKIPSLASIMDPETKWSDAHSAVRWSFVHFLMESPKYGKPFRAFVGNLPNNKEAGIHQEVADNKGGTRDFTDPKACTAAFEKRVGATLPALEKEWRDSLSKDVPMTPEAYFLAGESMLDKATEEGDDGNLPSEEAQKRYVQSAFEQFAAADAAGSRSSYFYRRYAELLRKGGIVETKLKIQPRPEDGEAAWKMIQKALALDPLEPLSYLEAGGTLLVDSPVQDLEKAAMFADVARIVAGPRDVLVKSLAEQLLAQVEPAREKRRKAAQQAAVATKEDARRWYVAFFFVENTKPPDNLTDLTTQQVRDLIRSGKVKSDDNVYQSWQVKDPKTGQLTPGTEPWDKGWVKVKDCTVFKDDLAAAAPAAPAGGAAPAAGGATAPAGGAATPPAPASGSGG